MKKYILSLFGIILFLSGTSCRQHDYRTLVINVPEMRNNACVRVIGMKLGQVPGIKREDVKFDVANRKITVTYDTLLAADKNVEFLIADAGFKANGIPANKKAAAALPPECRR
jgi:copper chaperone CopZ